MGLFSGLEGSLEKYIEGFFRDKFKGRVQPLEMAKRLAREMRDRKRVSISRVYVPNEYIVFLHPEDYGAVSSIAPMLARELEDYLVQKAAEKNFTLVAPPRVTLEADPALEGGQLRVTGAFGSAAPGTTAAAGPAKEADEDGAAAEETFEDTLRFYPARNTAPVPAVPEKPAARLEITAGPQQGRVFTLENRPLVIGRRDTCDLVLADTSVSRRHAQISFRQGEYVITDLGSTNGVYVNGVRVNSKVLAPGDTIKIGTTLCVFEVP
ncbi:FhaA domain-containing protein [Desulfotomaculum copahuensis]|uniref:FHA domain-containing protein n=1 Tax=Desulfotomaculum copahuensis TaxID=1838280 RepID=A0A1B7LED7_9FIRM|nr:DUF3662 and FHA domain-containing protein [Desulfotomaculum copahuensis]OAT81415.1 hypothetical protein A6M21_11130 [Desulfotomaculum copahuensis]